jgi:hypothetical protein
MLDRATCLKRAQQITTAHATYLRVRAAMKATPWQPCAVALAVIGAVDAGDKYRDDAVLLRDLVPVGIPGFGTVPPALVFPDDDDEFRQAARVTAHEILGGLVRAIRRADDVGTPGPVPSRGNRGLPTNDHPDIRVKIAEALGEGVTLAELRAAIDRFFGLRGRPRRLSPWARDYIRVAVEVSFKDIFDEWRTEAERSALMTALGRRTAVARELGVSARTVYSVEQTDEDVPAELHLEDQDP